MSINEMEKLVSEKLKWKRLKEESEAMEKQYEKMILANMTTDKMTLDEHKLTIIHNKRKTLNKEKVLAKYPELNIPEYMTVTEYDYLKIT